MAWTEGPWRCLMTMARETAKALCASVDQLTQLRQLFLRCPPDGPGLDQGIATHPDQSYPPGSPQLSFQQEGFFALNVDAPLDCPAPGDQVAPEMLLLRRSGRQNQTLDRPII